jgi:hypothetical protein
MRKGISNLLSPFYVYSRGLIPFHYLPPWQTRFHILEAENSTVVEMASSASHSKSELVDFTTAEPRHDETPGSPLSEFGIEELDDIARASFYMELRPLEDFIKRSKARIGSTCTINTTPTQ